jgi:uncharacterized protein (TIGR02271 family)
MRYEKVVTLFDTASHAEAARNRLEMAGFAASDISLIGKRGLPNRAGALREPGLWHRFFDRDIEANEAKVYGTTIESGGSVLTLRARDVEVPRALDILNQHELVDIGNRAMATGSIQGRTATLAPAPLATTESPPARAMSTDIGTGELLRLAEEQLEVGKRVVTSGTTRIRRLVTEAPVEAQVKLHEEHVEIVRRAASNPDYTRDIDWTDKTIEMIDTVEEPVVNKSIHVTEEVMIARKGSDHVETVRDTVRRQRVEVEPVDDERGRAMRLPHKELVS